MTSGNGEPEQNDAGGHRPNEQPPANPPQTNPPPTNPSQNNQPQNYEPFRRETPGTYKWAMGAGGLVTAATTAVLAIKPDTAGYSLSGLILFILLIFIVISLEVGTAKLDKTNPLAKDAQLQVKVMSWFATWALMLGASAIISSIFFHWPLPVTLGEDRTTQKYLDDIIQYDLLTSYIKRGPGERRWEEHSKNGGNLLYSFSEDYLTPRFLVLSDSTREIKVRIPTYGGLLQWSRNDRFDNCIDKEYCWGDTSGDASMRHK
jgi:hypothetical protein